MTTTKTIDIVKTVVKPIIKQVDINVVRKVSSKTIANEIASRITGNLVGFDDLYDIKTHRFLTENELKAKGAVFVTVSLNKILSKNDTVVKGRTTKNPTPFIRKTSKYQVITNINWESYVNKRGNGNFIAAEKRVNGVENYCECRAVGTTQAGNYTINGVAFKILEDTKYFDENGNEYPDKDFIEREYLKKQSKKSKEKEAEKHGIEVEFDPKYRTTRIDSCDSIKVFGFDFQPTE